MTRSRNRNVFLVVGLVASLSTSMVFADEEEHDYSHGEDAQEFVHGSPETISEPWLLAAGGRIYDNWADALDRKLPESTHPAYPASSEQSGSETWRCKECHGWDYLGAAGVYSGGSHFTGIKGIDGAIGMPEPAIAALLRSPEHGFTPEMISDAEMSRITAFVTRGQVDVAKYIDLSNRTVIAGDATAGRGVFQTVCAACHGFDGRRLDWGADDEHAYVGTEAVAAPDEVIHKILSAHPGVEMVNLRAFGADAAADVLAYLVTLPVK